MVLLVILPFPRFITKYRVFGDDTWNSGVITICCWNWLAFHWETLTHLLHMSSASHEVLCLALFFSALLRLFRCWSMQSWSLVLDSSVSFYKVSLLFAHLKHIFYQTIFLYFPVWLLCSVHSTLITHLKCLLFEIKPHQILLFKSFLFTKIVHLRVREVA